MPTRTANEDRFVRDMTADDPEILAWLCSVGLIESVTDGGWKLTAAGEAAMARFHDDVERHWRTIPPLVRDAV